jgi:ketosteroid isomerase-like protein
VPDVDTRAEAVIRQRIDECVNALRMKDIDGIMSLYAPDLVAFDVVPPLRYVGADAYRRRWQETFAAFAGPLDYELRDVHITAQGDLAFLHSLNHVQGTLMSGQSTDTWLRWTACLRRIEGVWLVVHGHVSVPASVEHKPGRYRRSDRDRTLHITAELVRIGEKELGAKPIDDQPGQREQLCRVARD